MDGTLVPIELGADAPLVIPALGCSPDDIDCARSARAPRADRTEPLHGLDSHLSEPGTPTRTSRRSMRSAGRVPKTAGVSGEGVGDAPTVDPFAPLTREDRAGGASIPAGAGNEAGGDGEPRQCRRVADGEPDFSIFSIVGLPEPSRFWIYRSAGGSPLAAVARYETILPNGSAKKEIRPWTHGRRVWTDAKGRPCDRRMALQGATAAPRPLYGLWICLAGTPGCACTGLRGREGGRRCFRDLPCSRLCYLAWRGEREPRSPDWSALRGRSVTIWPDHDSSRRRLCQGCRRALRAKPVPTTVCAVALPTDWPEG